MKNLIFICIVCLLWPEKLLASESKLGFTKNPEIEPGKSYEACMWLSPTERLHYEFTSSADLRFNIHYHEGEEVRYPVPVKLISSEKAVFESESRKHYCMMWKNPAKQKVELKLHYRRQEAGEK